MFPSPAFRLRPLPCLLLALTGIVLAGCGSRPERGGPPPGHPEAGPPVVAMQAEGRFFDGQVAAKATLARGRSIGPAPGGKRGDRPAGPPGVGEPGWGGPGGPMGGSREGGPPGGARPRAVHGPSLTLRVTLANLSQTELEIEIPEINSVLGNFAVRPERVRLAPGQSVELDPMISQLGVLADKIPLKVRLRLAGQGESQTLLLQPLAPPPS